MEVQDVKTIVVGNKHGLSPGKTFIATPLTRADGYREGDKWYSAADLAHDTVVEAVNHFGRHTTETGETLLVKSLDSPTVKVQVLRIRAVEVDKLTETDFRLLGYANRADYLADWGDVQGPRIWLIDIKRLDEVAQ
jgi:hypothetical protein